MPWRIVKQPNGLLARFSTIVDDFTHYNYTEAEALAMCVEEMGRKDAEQKIARGMQDCEPYTDKPRTGDGLNRFRESIETIQLIHGAQKAKRREKMLSRKVKR